MTEGRAVVVAVRLGLGARCPPHCCPRSQQPLQGANQTDSSGVVGGDPRAGARGYCCVPISSFVGGCTRTERILLCRWPRPSSDWNNTTLLARSTKHRLIFNIRRLLLEPTQRQESTAADFLLEGVQHSGVCGGELLTLTPSPRARGLSTAPLPALGPRECGPPWGTGQREDCLDPHTRDGPSTRRVHATRHTERRDSMSGPL